MSVLLIIYLAALVSAFLVAKLVYLGGGRLDVFGLRCAGIGG